jgi:hypothetical protein
LKYQNENILKTVRRIAHPEKTWQAIAITGAASWLQTTSHLMGMKPARIKLQ